MRAKIHSTASSTSGVKALKKSIWAGCMPKKQVVPQHPSNSSSIIEIGRECVVIR